MADTTKDKVQKAGHKIAEKATEVGHKVAEGLEEGKDWAKETAQKIGHRVEETAQKVEHKAKEVFGEGASRVRRARSARSVSIWTFLARVATTSGESTMWRVVRSSSRETGALTASTTSSRRAG